AGRRRVGWPAGICRDSASRRKGGGLACAISRPHADRISFRRVVVANSRASACGTFHPRSGARRRGGGHRKQSALSLSLGQRPFPQMDSRKLALLCRELADRKKAEDLVVLDVRAISDEIIETLREEHDLRPRAVDGTIHNGWIVVDYFDVLSTSCGPTFE